MVATLKSLGQKTSEESATIASTSHARRLNHSKQTPAESDTEIRKRKLMKIAPKLPFDIDLYHWEDKDLKAPSVEMYALYNMDKYLVYLLLTLLCESVEMMFDTELKRMGTSFGHHHRIEVVKLLMILMASLRCVLELSSSRVNLSQ